MRGYHGRVSLVHQTINSVFSAAEWPRLTQASLDVGGTSGLRRATRCPTTPNTRRTSLSSVRLHLMLIRARRRLTPDSYPSVAGLWDSAMIPASNGQPAAEIESFTIATTHANKQLNFVSPVTLTGQLHEVAADECRDHSCMGACPSFSTTKLTSTCGCRPRGGGQSSRSSSNRTTRSSSATRSHQKLGRFRTNQQSVTLGHIRVMVCHVLTRSVCPGVGLHQGQR